MGDPGGMTYDESVQAEVAGLRSLLGTDPVYGVAEVEEGCFALAQVRSEPRAPFGVEARICFDDHTGAPIDSRVEYAGGIIEVIAVAELRSGVDDADLEP
jgi:hypothetical protein